MELNRGLFDSKYILKNYKEEDKLRELSKKQLEKMIDTLEKELNFQTSFLSVFLAFTAVIFAVIFFIIPNINNELGSGAFKTIGKNTYQLESINLELKKEDIGVNYLDKEVSGTYKYFSGLKNTLIIIFGGSFLLIGIYLVFFSNIYSLGKLRKLYKNARYIHSLK